MGWGGAVEEDAARSCLGQQHLEDSGWPDGPAGHFPGQFSRCHSSWQVSWGLNFII